MLNTRVHPFSVYPACPLGLILDTSRMIVLSELSLFIPY
jgi:hypothetical protein